MPSRYPDLLIAVLWVLLPSLANAGLSITIAEKPPAAPIISQPVQDFGGTTSFRFLPPREGPPDKNDPAQFLLDSPSSKPRVFYYTRDRDLGQTFTVGDHPIRWESLTLRVGPTDSSVQPGASGAEIFLQVFQVDGKPRIDDHGTTGPDGSGDGKYTRWKTYNASDPKTDDFFTGETLIPLRVIKGILPEKLACNDWLRFQLSDRDQIFLKAHSAYAWVIGFTVPAPGRALALANCFHPNMPQQDYQGGHGLRRDGSTTDLEATFVRDLSDAADLAASRRAAAFPSVLAERLAIPPGTIGFPDVEGHRDFLFFIGACKLPARQTQADGSQQ